MSFDHLKFTEKLNFKLLHSGKKFFFTYFKSFSNNIFSFSRNWLVSSRGRHWDPSPNPKILGSIFQNFRDFSEFLGLGLGLNLENFGIGPGIEFENFWDWDWDWDWIWKLLGLGLGFIFSKPGFGIGILLPTPGYQDKKSWGQRNPKSLEKLRRVTHGLFESLGTHFDFWRRCGIF